MAVATIAVAIGMAIGGCKHHRDHEQHGHDESVEETIAFDRVPVNVRQGFEREFPGAVLKKVEKETYPNGLVHYCFEFVNKDGAMMEVEFDADGERLPEH
jgi:hypothetical protein